MNYIEQLQQLTLDDIEKEGLKSAIQELLDDYANTPNKQVFEEVAMENAKTLYELTKQAQPELLADAKVRKENRAIIRDTIIKLMTNWKMTSFKQVENAVNKALDEDEKKYKDND